MPKGVSNLCFMFSFMAAVSFMIATEKFFVGIGVFMLCMLFFKIMDEVCIAIRSK
jgi:hypothetical protein